MSVAAATPSALPPLSPRLQRWFVRYLRHYFRRHFDAVRVSRSGPLPPFGTTPLVFYTNHPSWWDPILLMLVFGTLADDCGCYGPMDADALEHYGILRRLGVFGVERSHAGLAAFLRTCDAILAQRRSLLCITAEGRFCDPRARPVRIEAGVAHVARRHPDVPVVPVAIEYPFWDERAPQALIRFGAPLAGPTQRRRGAADLRGEMERALEDNLDALAEEAQRRDPAAFDALVEGRKGVGGMHDLLQRLRARLRGERYDPAHSTVRGPRD